MTSPYSGHRVYNGCPDSEMQKRLNQSANLLKILERHVPDVHLTYFPVEGMWMAYVWNRTLSRLHYSKDDAIREAISNVKDS